MNKQDWTYKKLGEVATFVNGYPFKPSDWKDSGRKIIRIQNLNNPNAVYNFYDGSIDPKYLVSNGDVLISWSGSLGVFEWTEDEAILNQHIFKVVFNKEYINKKFFQYVVASRINEMKSKVHGVTMQHITKKEFDIILIPVPPIAEQERIVAELDLLSGIIEKKKEQLKAYDQLAQSIFYTMFGDPIDNPKGWETKNMGDIGDLQRGSGLSKKDLTENGFPCILYGQIHTRFGAFTKKHIACIPQELVKTAKIAHFGDVVMAITSEDVEGSCKSVAWMGNYDIAVGSDAAIYRHTLNPIYVSYYTQTKAFFIEKAKYAKGFKVTHISTKEIAKIPIPVPPLSLQEEFAEKVEAIERQKALVQQSIEETQTMFDFTMDKYFG